MRCLTAVSTIVAVLFLAGGVAWADGYVTGMNYFQLSNWGNGGGDGGGPAFQAGGWTATTGGAIWISSGGNSPVLDTQDLNFQLDYRSTPTSPWVILTGAYLLGNGVAYGDVAPGGTPANAYPGYFMGEDGVTALGNENPDSTSPYRMVASGNGVYYLPGSYNPQFPAGRGTLVGMQFNLCAWTGSYNTFAAAVSSGAQVAISGAFQVGPTSYASTSAVPYTTFSNMPSMVLKPTIPGDANLDGKVDVNDLTIVLANFGQTTNMNWSTGDFNGDGRVDVNDLTIVLAHFGQSVGSAGVAPVPEPSTVVIVAAGLLGLLAYARKSRG